MSILIPTTALHRDAHAKKRHAILRLVAIYLAFSYLWNLASGLVLNRLAHDPSELCRMNGIAGLVFILLTGSLLYLLIHRYIRQIAASEQSLRKSEQRFRSIFELAAVGVALIEPRSGRFVRINQKYCDITGYSAQELPGKRFQDMIHPDDRQSGLDEWLSEMTGTFFREQRCLHRNGSTIWVNLTVSPGWLEGQEPGGLIAIVEEITARKSAERALLLSEERHRAVVEDQTETICRFKADGSYIFVNDVFCRILGKTRDELLGSKWHPDLFADDVPSVAEKLRTLSPSNPVICVESRIYAGSGALRWMQFVNRGFFDQEGRLVETQAVGRDITERKQAEEALRTSDERLNMALGASRMGVWEWNVQTGAVIWSPESCAILEVEGFDGTMGSFTKALHPDDADRVTTAANWALAKKTAFSVEFRIPRSCGELRWFSALARPMYDQNGRPLRLIGTVQDITERKNAEIALSESKELLQAVINGTNDAIFVKDRNSRILLANPAYLRIFGKISQEVIGKYPREIHPYDIAATIQANDRQVVETGQARMLEETVQGAAGRRSFLAYKIPRRDADGRVIGLIGISHDTTLSRQAEEDRLALERQFQQAQKLESLGVLAGGVAHDFNNILTIILGHCLSLKEEIGCSAGHAARVQQIETAAFRAADLCRQMLSYSGKSPLLQTQVNTWLLVDEIARMLKSAIRKNVAFELDIRRDVPAVTGDKAQIQQIVMNLIINATEAVADKNGTVRVELTKTEVLVGEKDFLGDPIPAGSYARLVVSDTGCGMTEETQKRIFEPFFSTKVTGRGLGMSAVLGIIKSHHAALQLSSAPGNGTTFTVYFPLARSPVTADTGAAQGPALPLRMEGAILLVEDEETLCTLGAALLCTMGLSAITASNGREALEIYRQRAGQIDLVLLDLVMPEMDGVETYRELRAMDPTVPVVICSGYGVDEVVEITDHDEHTGFVQKPYRRDQLRSVLLKFLG